ncbi:hypothetical protein [Celerinatantimonas diazotrophica]|uniref:Uncharacterized protein n=1 Tax=Celerinatantimonas diazotrophica TaxID=412034 RepID=A0A4R1K3U2_9GAMM|nr:hypothetical protein [Celerinatantimonas diazotrophica]TCK58752.1 hypothetical protein EV690_0896 [Celerinatantimonas diazotrophica]CAG9297383.1 hypothetical protein CEDIAZO_02564 [Celerinatantimonas diazotrophica]
MLSTDNKSPPPKTPNLPCLSNDHHLLYLSDNGEFKLYGPNSEALSATLDIQLNHLAVFPETLSWHHRSHGSHHEIWSFSPTDQLSLSLTFTLSATQLTIDYVARTESPAHIQLQHQLNFAQYDRKPSTFYLTDHAYFVHSSRSRFSRIPESLFISDHFAATLSISFNQNVT